MQHAARISEAFVSIHSTSNGAIQAGGWVVWADNPTNLVDVTNCWKDLQLLKEHTPRLDSPAVFVVAEALPKGAKIEVQLLLLQNQQTGDNQGDESRFEFDEFQSGFRIYNETTRIFWEILINCNRGTSVIYMDEPSEVDFEDTVGLGNIAEILKSALSIRLFCSRKFSQGVKFLSHLSGSSKLPITVIPVRFICDRHGRPWSYAMCTHSKSNI